MKLATVCLLLAFIAGCDASNKQESKSTENQTKNLIEKNVESNNVDDKKESDTEKKNNNEIEFKVSKVSTSSGINPSIDISFTEEPKAQNLESYIKVEPHVEIRTIKMRNHIILTGPFDISKGYKITLLKGLQGEQDSFKENQVLDVTFKEAEPAFSFSNEGIILPKINENKIAFRSINIKKVNLKITKIFPNNTTQFLQDFSFKGNGNIFSYVLQDNMYKLGEVVVDKNFDLKYQKNIWNQNEIDLKNIINDKGVYIVELFFNEKDVDYNFPDSVPEWKRNYFFSNNGHIGKALLVTDMGIVAQKEKDGQLIATVLDVVNNKPLSNVVVKGISVNNQLVSEGKTDKNGEVILEKGNKIFYLTAENNNETSLLKMSDSQLSYDGFLVDGEFAKAGSRAFIYSSRGIYRPGDEINIGIIARNDKGTYPKDQPIKIDVFTPRGDKYIDGKVIKDNKDGFFTFNFTTEKTSDTGIWTIVVYTGGDQNKKFSLKVPVETVVPYKIEVDTKFPANVDIKDTTEIVGEVKSKYLFGNPAKGLNFASEINLTAQDVKFKQYKNFTFTNPTSYSPNFVLTEKGKLNDAGESKIIFKDIPKDIPTNMTLHGEVVTRVIENSGRPVINTNTIMFNKFKSYVGVEAPEDNFVKSGDKLNLEVITVSDEDGTFVPGRKIKYRIYKNEYSWWWDYYEYNDFIKSIKNDKNTVLLYEGEFESTGNPYIIDYAVQGTGEIFVEVEDMATKQSAGTTLYANTWQDPTTNKVIDKLKIETDKKAYKVGEKAVVTFEGEKGNKALITVTKSGKIINRYWKDIDDSKNSIDIEIKEDMFPNAYVTVALFQNYGKASNDRPLRLYGAVPLMVEDFSKKLELEIETPEVLHPNEKFKVKLKNKEQGKVDYTLSVVDEGLLNITNFKTPNPYNYFYSKEGLQVSAYDNYSEIIGTIFGPVHQILTPGGDEFFRSMNMAAKLNSLGFDQTERFKPLSIFKGVLSTNENGEGEVEVILPDYNGAVRVMVTAAQGTKYGMSQKKIEVKSPIIADISMPRILKIGDKFKVPVKIFAMEQDLGQIEVGFNFQGTQQKVIIDKLEKNDSKNLYFNVNVGNTIGNEEAILTIKSQKYNVEKKIDISVASNNPYTVINKIEFVKDGQVEFKLPKDSVKNSVNGQITISSRPILAIDNRINEMIKYPYGCLEQITSMAIPQLYITELSTNKNIDKEKIVENINETIRRYSAYQLPNGGFSYWPGGENESYWASIYAGQFMILAKSKGYYVPEALYENWLAFAKDLLRTGDINNEMKAYTLYVLSLGNDPEIGELNYIYDNEFDKLSEVGKWYIAGTYNNIGEEELAKKIATDLPKKIRNQKKEDYSYSYGSKLRDEAIILDIYSKIFDNIEINLYKNIVENLQSNEWLSTQTIGYSMLALGDIKKKTQDSPVKGSIVINGDEKEFTDAKGIYQISLDGTQNDIVIKGNNLFVNEYWQGIPINYQRENESSNMSIERKFYAENGKEINVDSLSVGTTFYMILSVDSTEKDSNQYYSINNVALTQIIPSGWEIENVRVLDIQYPEWIENKITGNSLDYEDIRDDRVNFFFNFNNYTKHKQNFVVKLNAVTKGEYILPGATVQAMYDSAYNAYLKGFKVEVK